jgi:hypothetical protein
MTRRTSDPARPRWIALRRLSGEPVTAGGFTVTPQSRALTVRLPFAAFVWQRPVSVTVEQDGRTTELPIRNVTRLARLAVTAGVLLCTLILRVLEPRRKERES